VVCNNCRCMSGSRWIQPRRNGGSPGSIWAHLGPLCSSARHWPGRGLQCMCNVGPWQLFWHPLWACRGESRSGRRCLAVVIKIHAPLHIMFFLYHRLYFIIKIHAQFHIMFLLYTSSSRSMPRSISCFYIFLHNLWMHHKARRWIFILVLLFF
jgi:hypothetical protein